MQQVTRAIAFPASRNHHGGIVKIVGEGRVGPAFWLRAQKSQFHIFNGLEQWWHRE